MKGPRVNQLHHGAKHTTSPATQLYAVCFLETEEEEKKILEEKRGNYSQELSGFHVSEIRATDDALVLTLEFTLAVK